MITVLFHKCYYAFLRGDFEESRIFFDLLKEEFREVGDRNALNKHQLRLLKRAKTAIDTGKVSQAAWLQNPNLNNADEAKKLKPDKTHKQLVRAIYEESAQLKELIGNTLEGFCLHNIEHPCPPHGRADMLYLDNVYAYPIEVKPGAGGHDVVGQILKYEQSLRMLLHIRTWEDVRPITICWDYSEFALKALKGFGITTLKYRTTKKGLKLIKT